VTKTLAVAFAAALLAPVFVLLGSEVLEGDTSHFDAALLEGAQALRQAHPAIVTVMRDFSGLGSTSVLTLVTVLTVGYLLLVAQRRTAALVAVSMVCGAVLVACFKAAYGRWRPDAAYAAYVVDGPSFPSGHAGMSAIAFLTIGALVAATRTRAAERAFFVSAGLLLSLLVGISRVILGLHWGTDVIGGWVFGTGWALTWLLIDRAWVNRSGIQAGPPDTAGPSCGDAPGAVPACRANPTSGEKAPMRPP
jgi:undecaprenyl-diphosphatase